MYYPEKLMVSNRKLRIFGYVFTFFVHVANLLYMDAIRDKGKSLDTDLEVFKMFEYRYFTIWTLMLQIIYATFGFVCDMLLYINEDDNEYKLHKQIVATRYIMFSALVWPCTMVVCTVFWSVFIYDRSLIFPEFLDDIIPWLSNHVIHTLIVPIAFWEVMFGPRFKPRSHIRNILQLILHMAVYLTIFYYTFYKHGIWLYPIFAVTYGTINFIVLHLAIAVLFFIFYHLQWILNYLFHGEATVQTKKQKIE